MSIAICDNCSERREDRDMSQTTLITPRQLAPRLEDRELAGIRCRFDLGRPEWGREAHASARIPHALYAPLDHDLSGKVSAATGRHPLPSVEEMAERLGRWGIDAQMQVV